MRKKKAPKESLDDIFSSLENTATPELFENDKCAGIEIRWSIKGVGFGQLVLVYSKEKRKWHADTEQMTRELLKEILHLAAPKLADLMISVDEYNDRNKAP